MSSPDEQAFVRLAEAELAKLDDALASLERDDFDWQLADGVLSVDFAGRGKIIVSVNRPAHEIWMAARASGLHFGFDAATRTFRTHKGEELWASFSELASQCADEPIRLSGPTD